MLFLLLCLILKVGTTLNTELRGKQIDIEVVKMPFVESNYYKVI